MHSIAETAQPSPEHYFHKDPDGTIRFLDPKSGNVLQPGTIPESLLADEELRQGFDFLASQGNRIHLRLLLSGHAGTNALADSGVDLRAVSTELAANNGVFIIEGASKVRNLTATQIEESKQFTDSVVSQVRGIKIPHVINPDSRGNSSRPADQALVSWWRAIERVNNPEVMDARMSSGPNGELQVLDEWLSLYVGFQVYRNWYLVGKTGARLAELEAQGKLNQDIDMAALFGSQHPGYGHHFEAVGADVSYEGEYGNRLSGVDAALTHLINTGTMSLKDRVQFLVAVQLEAEDRLMQAHPSVE